MARRPTNEAQIRGYYRVLTQAWGQQHWWPARTRFEVIVGAYLTQNTAWTNVHYALVNLKRAGLLSLSGIRQASLAELEELIRPAGYFRQKAQRLKTFVAFLDARHRGSLHRMFAQPTAELRKQLLELNGVGPETADSILLYSGDHPVFVVDAYTGRIVERHRLLSGKPEYEAMRQLFERALADLPDAGRRSKTGTDVLRPAATPQPVTLTWVGQTPTPRSTARRSTLAQVYNEMHALLVAVGKKYCWKTGPKCGQCPLRVFLPGK
jgi:endonuclease-3 related protein